MAKIPENWPHWDNGIPYPCELCDAQPPSDCQCPNGPWNDIEAGIKFLLAENSLRNDVIKAADKFVTATELEMHPDKARLRYSRLFDALEALEASVSTRQKNILIENEKAIDHPLDATTGAS